MTIGKRDRAHRAEDARPREDEAPGRAVPGEEARGGERQAAEAPVPADQGRPETGSDVENTAVVEPAAEAVQRLEREAAEWKDRALRAAADFDNYRKRAIREREEQFARGQAEVLARISEVIDDLARVAHLDPAQTTAAAFHEGMLQIERKFLKTLDAAGLERIDPLDQPFDPNVAEAVTVLPAQTPEQDQTVGMVLQAGYRLRGTLLRPARVAVRAWRGDAAAGDEAGEAGAAGAGAAQDSD